MYTNNIGYIFECREASGKLGIMENFKVYIHDNERRVSIISCVDFNGNLVTPAFVDLSSGFEPLSRLADDMESLSDTVERFVRSNKPYFGVLDSIALIAVMKLVYDVNTGELIEDGTSIELYMPKIKIDSLHKAVPNAKGKDCPALVCEKLDSKDGINTYVVTNTVLKGYEQKLLSNVSSEICKDRYSYLYARSGGE